ncbi:type II toxin-antitoxin system RelE family toxin [Candidatus Nanohalobium constans]|uniref:Type II toxin-antitoxin system RelE/ParE family toxin n=1 Tax=Candidatus Nanohalobium constans TaxID=2565781 RepID=A0A5Q0UFW9_9ARCH|nr:type II toxin-antitoxin system RelE/ParE family toxin [Candidatus Nanohalobium constans]QGA80496.1 type II toxin-antitoxin system RelE/ParE family toxin [Candidatus Nanohalobium constans]
MKYEVILSPEAQEYLEKVDEKSEKIIRNKLKSLYEAPHPRPNRKAEGDVEKVTMNGQGIYRMHISRSHTAFYWIKEDENTVDVTNIVDIDKAHKMYD